MEEKKIKAHAEGARSATDTLSGSVIAGAALVVTRLFLERRGVTLTEGELLAVGACLTGVFTGISSYVHGFFRGKK
jgi:hypothetical protein